ncbi:TetR family transcriptional regulator [uncultured Ruminococcus sp.]|uniref:TetR family transcriptional regulator n=1 Tax=uncultured Ruminococcus sp. TaxID=165186 RepID=UPI0025FA4D4A|nr:TetR family transcriptional regulator [uncultured Ruminococcus sp.]
MKRKTTNDILAESFPELAQTKRIDKITISDITSNCGMSQPTFYNHFKDKYDLIVWIYTNHVREIMCKIDNKTFMWKDCLLGAALYYYENSEFIKNALKHTSGQDSFVENVRAVGRACFRR